MKAGKPEHEGKAQETSDQSLPTLSTAYCDNVVQFLV